MSRMILAIADAFSLDEGTVRETIRRLRDRGDIPGANMAGHTAPEATTRDLAKVALALLSGNQPTKAPANFERSKGLIAATDGRQGYLLDILEATFDALVEHGEIEGVIDLTIAVSRPWPYARMRFVYTDGTIAVAEFHHEEAKETGDPFYDRAVLDVLIRKWRYRPGSTQWGEIALPKLKFIADMFAGRTCVSSLRPPPAQPPPLEAALWSEARL